MPTTNQETLVIGQIINKYVDHDKITPLIKDLVEQVGYTSWNYSVRKSLFDLYRLVNPNWTVPTDVITNLAEKWDSGPAEYTSHLRAHEFCGLEWEEWITFVKNKPSKQEI